MSKFNIQHSKSSCSSLCRSFVHLFYSYLFIIKIQNSTFKITSVPGQQKSWMNNFRIRILPEYLVLTLHCGTKRPGYNPFLKPQIE